jgi:hypothetical protein
VSCFSFSKIYNKCAELLLLFVLILLGVPCFRKRLIIGQEIHLNLLVVMSIFSSQIVEEQWFSCEIRNLFPVLKNFVIYTESMLTYIVAQLVVGDKSTKNMIFKEHIFLLFFPSLPQFFFSFGLRELLFTFCSTDQISLLVIWNLFVFKIFYIS